MTQVDHDGTPFELLPQDLRTHLGDFARAVEIAVSVSNIDSNEESYWIKQRECIERIKGQIAAANTDPWSTDLEAAPLDRDVLVFCEDTKEYFVAYRYSEKLKGAFCFGNHKGTFLICTPTKWREIPV